MSTALPTSPRPPADAPRRSRARRGRGLLTLLALTTSAAMTTALLPAPPAEAVFAARSPYPVGTPTLTLCNDDVCVHRATSGPHAATAVWAQTTLDFVDAARFTLVEVLGFPAPSATPDATGDQRMQVYLTDLDGRHADGLTVVGSRLPSQPRRAHTHLLIDNDMRTAGDEAEARLAATVAHEYFHTIQMNMDAAADDWFLEASATWAEAQVFPQYSSSSEYLREGQFGNRKVPLDSPVAGYGNHHFIQHLADVLGADAVRQVWARLDTATGPHDTHALQAIGAVLKRHGWTWHRFFAEHQVANQFPSHLFSAPRAAALGAPAAPDRVATLTAARPRDTKTWRLSHLTSRVVTVKLSPRVGQKQITWRLRSTAPAVTQAQVVLVRADGSLKRIPVKIGRKGRALVRVAPTRAAVSGASLRSATLVLSNTSREFTRCGSGSAWTCSGVPRHDKLKVKVTAHLR